MRKNRCQWPTKKRRIQEKVDRVLMWRKRAIADGMPTEIAYEMMLPLLGPSYIREELPGQIVTQTQMEEIIHALYRTAGITV